MIEAINVDKIVQEWTEKVKLVKEMIAEINCDLSGVCVEDLHLKCDSTIQLIRTIKAYKVSGLHINSSGTLFATYCRDNRIQVTIHEAGD